MTLPVWPKIIKLDDVVDAVDALAERIATLETKYDAVVSARGERIAALEADIAEHRAGAVERQREVDKLKADTARLRWAATTGRRP